MLIKAKAYIPAIKTLEEVDITLNPDEAYWLVGVIGAQTDAMARKIYDALSDSIAKETGENKYRVHESNEFSRAAHKMATGNRKGYGEVVSLKPEDKTVSFYYEGLWREVSNVSIKGRHLSGVELTRAGKVTEQFKTYLLTKINYS